MSIAPVKISRRRLAMAAALLSPGLKALRGESPGRYPMPPESFRFGEAIRQARAVANELMRAKQLPGLSIAIARSGSLAWSEGFGLSNLELAVPVSPLTRFRLGSVSKVLTAAGLARLVEDGKLDLDAPVQRYVPGFPVKQWPVTTRQLAGHTAGIRHYGDDFAGPLKGAPHFDSVAKGLSIFAKDPLLFEPGTSYAYSSYGWNLISAVMEGASKEEFLTYMQRAVFEPLGLRSITADHVDRIIPHRTAFYARGEGGVLRNAEYTDNSYKWASGGLLANAEDLVRFGAAHLQPGFFRQSTLDLLFTSQKLASGKPTGVGIAWRSGTSPNGRRILHHGGSLDGGRAMLMMLPDSGIVVAMLANVYADFGEKEAIQIAELFASA